MKLLQNEVSSLRKSIDRLSLCSSHSSSHCYLYIRPPKQGPLLDRVTMQTLIGSNVLHMICIRSTPSYAYKVKVHKSSVAHVLETASAANVFARLWLPNNPSRPPRPPMPTGSNEPSETFVSCSRISIVTWNCRGLASSRPYIDKLSRDGVDIIALQEHWLWPFELDRLASNHQYSFTAKADNRLNETSNLTTGCGGVAMKHLICTPLSDIPSDRICGISVKLEKGSLIIICAYLPAHGDTVEFQETLSELEDTVSFVISSSCPGRF